MFERFTKAARDAVVQAQQEARTLGHGRIGTEHILLAMLSATDRPPAQVLAAMGLTYDEARAAVRRYVGTDDLDADALGTIGIDLGAVREKVEQVFGPGALDRPRGSRAPLGGHVPFAPRAKKVLELSLREAIRLKHNFIADSHILLGILREGEGVAMKVIVDAGIDTDALRTRITALLAAAS
ncbi:ATP-dependent Clp protease ATP-binding subunit ClpA [Thermocatellispora tengchongensis]|uniref:ATP-dependent Clp protease ATP-binding subunit ClpA n=1 Tax=Thermocatellispora tengchongensis TaxID=1073253 RepID=A0A840PD73_9ACTN|nr:Clp protease N-terminal domain-containing protein [Thermocatellispora tengchongensis]MBB5133985.1 ATP-dependent Clp protease ATP-binding subunit ClpA [Thermocatellispora tengchongensis]